MPTNNAWNSENPAQVARGGTGRATLTNGAVLLGDTTDPVEMVTLGKGQLLVGRGGVSSPNALAVGTDGHVLTLDSSVTQGVKWAAAGASSAASWDLVGTATASNDATIEFTGLTSAYEFYKIFIWDCVAENDDALFRMYFSSNGGTSYKTVYDHSCYGMDTEDSNDTVTSRANPDQAQIELTLQHEQRSGSAITEDLCAEMTLFDPTNGDCTTHVQYQMTGHDDASPQPMWCINGAGTYNQVEAINAIQFKFHNGDIVTGEFRVYGIAV